MNETDIQTIMIDNKTINQRIENSLNVIFADIDITAAQGRVLMYIANSPGKDIFAAALIKKLRKSGYISCTGCESDERYKNLTATNKGRQTAGLISRHMRNIEQAAFRSFTDSELNEFMRLQKKLLNNIDNINTDNLKQKG